MKKSALFLVLILTFSVLFSCSNDNDSENQLVVKKITEEIFFYNSSEITTENFIYENSKLVKSIRSNGDYVTFLYEDNKVVKFIKYNASNELVGATNLTYNGNDLVKIEPNAGELRNIFFYQNGKLSSQEDSYFNITEYIPTAKREYTFDYNNNVVQILSTGYYQNVSTSKSVYTFDDKNNPLKNMNKYLRLFFSTEGLNGLSNNNRISQDVYSPISNTTPTNFTYEYIFNSDNYPTTIKKFRQNETLVSNTTIEYQSN